MRPLTLLVVLIATVAQADQFKALFDASPELTLPLDLPGTSMPQPAKVPADQVAALRAALVHWGDNFRASLGSTHLAEESNLAAHPPIRTHFDVLGRVNFSGHAGLICEFVRVEGEGGPDDKVEVFTILVTLSPQTGTLIDCSQLSNSNQYGDQSGRLEASGRITIGRSVQPQQEGRPKVVGPGRTEQVRASGIIDYCEDTRDKPRVSGPFVDRKSKESMTFTFECRGRTSIAYRAGPGKPAQWMVVTKDYGKKFDAQFMNSTANYSISWEEGDDSATCINPDKTEQEFKLK